MAPNQSEPRRQIIERELSYRIINAFFEVYNALGPGFLESVYAKALVMALRKRGIGVALEVPIKVVLELGIILHFGPEARFHRVLGAKRSN